MLLKWYYQDTLNFTYTMKRPSDNSWGSLNPDGTWTGIVGELHTDQADIGTQAYSISNTYIVYQHVSNI